MKTRYARNGELRIACELRGNLHWQRPWLVLVQGWVSTATDGTR
jgi:hypothetical protein